MLYKWCEIVSKKHVMNADMQSRHISVCVCVCNEQEGLGGGWWRKHRSASKSYVWSLFFKNVSLSLLQCTACAAAKHVCVLPCVFELCVLPDSDLPILCCQTLIINLSEDANNRSSSDDDDGWSDDDVQGLLLPRLLALAVSGSSASAGVVVGSLTSFVATLLKHLRCGYRGASKTST